MPRSLLTSTVSLPSLISLSGLCDNIIQDIIYTYLVLPNRITIPLVGEAELAKLRFPMPKVKHSHTEILWKYQFHCFCQ